MFTRHVTTLVTTTLIKCALLVITVLALLVLATRTTRVTTERRSSGLIPTRLRRYWHACVVLLLVSLIGSVPLRAVKIIDNRTLSEVVSESDYVVVGVIQRAFALDGHGKEIKTGNPASGPGSDVQLGFEVAVAYAGILKSRGPELSPTITIYCVQADLDLDSQKMLQGKQFVFLLKRSGRHFEGTDYGFSGGGLHWPSERRQIEVCLAQSK